MGIGACADNKQKHQKERLEIKQSRLRERERERLLASSNTFIELRVIHHLEVALSLLLFGPFWCSRRRRYSLLTRVFIEEVTHKVIGT